MKTWHLRFSSDGRRPLFDDEARRRAAVRLIYRHAGPWLVLFRVADDKVHVVVYCSAERSQKLKRAVLLGLRPLAETAFEPAFIKPVDTRPHLKWLLDDLLDEDAHHDRTVHPALWSGSCFADLVGARVVDRQQLGIYQRLPRTRPANIWRAVGLPASGVAPVSNRRLRELGIGAISLSAAAASCCDPALLGRATQVVDARAATVQLARGAGFPMAEIWRVLGGSRQGLYGLAARPIDGSLLRAVRMRLAIDQRVLEQANGGRRSAG